MNRRLHTHTHTDEMFGQKQISHGHFCLFLNTGFWGGIFFFQLLKEKREGGAQKCIREGEKGRNEATVFPGGPRGRKQEAILRIQFSHHWAGTFIIGPLGYTHILALLYLLSWD